MEEDSDKQRLLDNKDCHHGDVDGGWGWVVLVACPMMQFLLALISGSLGFQYVALEQELSLPLDQVTIVGGLYSGCYFLTVTVIGPVCADLGCRRIAVIGSILQTAVLASGYFYLSLPVLVVIGFVGGISGGFMYSASLIVINSYFLNKRPLAFAVTFGGAGVGLCVVGPLITFLLETFGIRGTYLMLSALAFQNLAAAVVYFPVPNSKEPVESVWFKVQRNMKLYANKSLWSQPMFVLVHLSIFLFNVTYYTFYSFLPAFLTQEGISLEETSLVMAIGGVATTFGRLFVAVLSKFPVVVPATHIFTTLLGGLFLLVHPFGTSLGIFFFLACGFSLSSGLSYTLTNNRLIDLFGVTNYGINLGIANIGTGLASVVATVLLSKIATYVPITGVEQYLGGAAGVLAGLCLLSTLTCKPKADVNAVLADAIEIKIKVKPEPVISAGNLKKRRFSEFFNFTLMLDKLEKFPYDEVYGICHADHVTNYHTFDRGP